MHKNNVVIDGAAMWAQWARRCRRCRPSYKRRRKQKGTASMKKAERHWPSSSSDFSPNPSPVLAVPHSNLSDSSSKLYPEFLSVLAIVIWRSRTITISLLGYLKITQLDGFLINLFQKCALHCDHYEEFLQSHTQIFIFFYRKWDYCVCQWKHSLDTSWWVVWHVNSSPFHS